LYTAAVATSLHNTLTGRLEPVSTGSSAPIKLYVCGLTVYDHAHVGHMRTFLTYDLLIRHLREQGQVVEYVRNVTDIDDKILRRAAECGQTPRELAGRFEQALREDTARLGLIEPDQQPRVSEHLDAIRGLIERLIGNGVAYVSEGDVYFSVAAFPDYGKLSHRKQADLAGGASGRLDDEELRRKRAPSDFALWKRAKPGEPAWESPWSQGRPGWHIECSAMSLCTLGESFDIHGGGLDLVFPHHENEIAQSEAASGKPMARLWMHGGFIEVNREKMSKSLGNFMTARDCYRLVEPEALRYLALTAHYRAPLGLDWSVDDGVVSACSQLEDAERRVEYVYRTRERLLAIPAQRLTDGSDVPEEISGFAARLQAALDDDLNAPVALAAVSDLLRQINELAERTKTKKGGVARKAIEAAGESMARLGRVLGLGTDDPAALLGRIRQRRAQRTGLVEAEIDAKLAERVQARSARDYARADAIRDEIANLGVELMDGPSGTTWRLP
jgi:cysteinyl-tRNA synthetase